MISCSFVKVRGASQSLRHDEWDLIHQRSPIRPDQRRGQLQELRLQVRLEAGEMVTP